MVTINSYGRKFYGLLTVVKYVSACLNGLSNKEIM